MLAVLVLAAETAALLFAGGAPDESTGVPVMAAASTPLLLLSPRLPERPVLGPNAARENASLSLSSLRLVLLSACLRLLLLLSLTRMPEADAVIVDDSVSSSSSASTSNSWLTLTSTRWPLSAAAAGASRRPSRGALLLLLNGPQWSSKC